jgi:hypothetical protein
MPRKKIVTTEEINEAENENKLPEFPSQIPDEDPLSAFDGYSNISIKVYRWTNTGTVFVFKTDTPFDEAFLQEHYGAGRYLVKIWRDGVKHREDVEMRVEGAPTGTPTQAKTTSPDSKTAHELGNDVPQSFMQTLLLRLVGANGGAIPQERTPVGELVEAVKGVVSLTGNGSNGNAAKDFSEGFKAGIEMAKSAQGIMSPGNDEDWKTTAFRMLKETVPGVVAAISSARAPVTNTGVQHPATVLPNPGLPLPTQMSEQEQMDAIIKKGIAKLKPLCMMGVSPDSIIDLIAAQVGNVEYQQIIHTAFAIEFDAFAKIDPEIANEPYATWFRSLYNGLRSAFRQPDDMDDDTGGDSGNPRNVTDNGNVGAAGGKK